MQLLNSFLSITLKFWGTERLRFGFINNRMGLEYDYLEMQSRVWIIRGIRVILYSEGFPCSWSHDYGLGLSNNVLKKITRLNRGA